MFLSALTSLNYMKLVLSSFLIFLFFLCAPVLGEEIYKKYIVKVSGIKIGSLIWEVKINEKKYLNSLKLKSEGLLSRIYEFNGEYFSKGVLEQNKLTPIEYGHVWNTNKNNKNMNLIFQDEKLLSLIQTPAEKEHLRINIFNIKKTKDPVSSFLQIIMGEKNSLVVDGRRIYTMNGLFNKKTNQTMISISNYSNLWADHKRSKFEKIIFEKKSGSFLPTKINIYFDGKIFKLEQD